MNKDFDLDKAEKQMPYTTSEDFFDKLEENIWKEIKDDYLAEKPKEHAHRFCNLAIPLIVKHQNRALSCGASLLWLHL